MVMAKRSRQSIVIMLHGLESVQLRAKLASKEIGEALENFLTRILKNLKLSMVVAQVVEIAIEIIITVKSEPNQ